MGFEVTEVGIQQAVSSAKTANRLFESYKKAHEILGLSDHSASFFQSELVNQGAGRMAKMLSDQIDSAKGNRDLGALARADTIQTVRSKTDLSPH